MTKDKDTSDHQEVLVRLLRKTARRDWQAFSMLYAMTSPRLFGLILHMTDYSEASEDLLQEVYFKAWRQADRYEPGKSKVTTWLSSIARNQTIDWMRSQESGIKGVTSVQSPEALALSAGVVPDASETSDRLDSNSGLSACMDQLSTSQRQAVFLTYLKGHTHSELVEKLGKPLGTVKSWVRRGLQSLRACLERDGGNV